MKARRVVARKARKVSVQEALLRVAADIALVARSVEEAAKQLRAMAARLPE